MGDRRRKWLKRGGLALASTLFSLLLAEGALSVLGIGDPVLRDVDPVLGWAPIAGAEGWWTREGRGHVVITEHGFRGVLVPEGKPPGTLRVVVLGDSYTEARQVALEDSFGVRLEAGLNTCHDAPVEVLAFGVSGYGTAQQRVLLEHRVWDFDPDVVIVAFLTGNDVADNHPALRVSGDPAPYYVFENGALVLDDSFTESEDFRRRTEGGWSRDLRRRSRLVRMVSGLGRTRRHHAGRGELGLRDEIYDPTPSGDWEEAWARTDAILAAMNRDVTARGARFGVVTLSNAVQVDPDPAVREAFRARLGVPDLEAPDRRIRSFGEREGFEVLTLVPILRAHAEEHDVQLHGFENTEMGAGHWNEAGHRVAANAMSEWLCDNL
ncbi:MAG: SGNH/GDSL hydrolase family protein [Sandaracinaceae bacterium]